MQDQINKLNTEIAELKRIVVELSLKVAQANQLQIDVSDKQIINKKVQFLQPVYDKNGVKKIN